MCTSLYPFLFQTPADILVYDRQQMLEIGAAVEVVTIATVV